MAPRVCVTAGGGFIGSWLVKLLLSRGYAVHATVRDPRDPKNAFLTELDGAPGSLRLFKADTLDYDTVAAAFAGCEGVFHVATPVPEQKMVDPEKEMMDPTVKGTMNVLKACTATQVGKLILVSSIATCCFNPDWPRDKIKDESCWTDKEFCKQTENWYSLAKTEAEEMALEYGEKNGLHVASFLPSPVFRYLDGSVPAPPKTITKGFGDEAHPVPNPAYEPWRGTDQAVLGALLSSMTEELLAQMTRATSSATVWIGLGAMFTAHNRASVRQLRTQLSQTKKKDMSAAEFYHKMTGYADALATVGEVLSDDEIIGHIIGGLGQEYDPIMTTLSICTGTVSLSDFYAYLLSFEARQEQHAANDDDFSPSGNSVMRHGNGGRPHDGNRNNNRGNNRNGGNGGNGGYGGHRNGGGGDDNRNRRPPRCQICREEGHYATDCRDRFNHAYQFDAHHSGNMAVYGGNRDNHWYLQTGATDHLTHDLETA